MLPINALTILKDIGLNNKGARLRFKKTKVFKGLPGEDTLLCQYDVDEHYDENYSEVRNHPDTIPLIRVEINKKHKVNIPNINLNFSILSYPEWRYHHNPQSDFESISSSMVGCCEIYSLIVSRQKEHFNAVMLLRGNEGSYRIEFSELLNILYFN